MTRRANREGSVYKRADGRWCATVSLDGGRRKSFYGRRREDVARWRMNRGDPSWDKQGMRGDDIHLWVVDEPKGDDDDKAGE